MQIYAEGRDGAGRGRRIGLEQKQRGLRVRVNGKEIGRVSDLAHLVPVQIITPNMHELLERGPGYRRKLLDWGVFHVEHSYRDWYARYRKALTQRNAAIRAGEDIDYSGLTGELAASGEKIDSFRSSYVVGLNQLVGEMLSPIEELGSARLRYRRGWEDDVPLEDALGLSRPKDLRRFCTTVGIHRADLLIEVEGKLADTVLSRGQQKILLSALRLAQGRLVEIQGDYRPILLMDDFYAELDRKYRTLLYRLVSKFAGQSFLTTIEAPNTENSIDNSDAMFHVEHGFLRRLS